MFGAESKSKRRVGLDISPLLDVAFQLIIFFAVTTTFLEEAGMQLELPESTTATAEEVSATVVSVTEDGQIRFQGELVNLDELEAGVAALSEEELARITVRADRHVEYGLIVQVIDALRKAGAEGLSLPMEAVEQQGQGRAPGGTRGPPGGS